MYFSYSFLIPRLQESPTGELVDYGFSMEEESNEHEASEQTTSSNEVQEDPETQVEVDARSSETFCKFGKNVRDKLKTWPVC